MYVVGLVKLRSRSGDGPPPQIFFLTFKESSEVRLMYALRRLELQGEHQVGLHQGVLDQGWIGSSPRNGIGFKRIRDLGFKGLVHVHVTKKLESQNHF